jgi:hypothetical protein
MRLHYYRLTENDEPELCSVSQARKLLKLNNGCGKAWTEHYDRDGGLFEVTPITLDGSNKGSSYNVKYNHHL